MITLRQLRYFEALTRHLHFGRAAVECAVSQPALSMQIQELETELGVQLLERRREGLALSVEGQEIARRARRILREVQDLGDFAKLSGAGLAGEMTLGVIPSVAPYLLPLVLPALRQRYGAMKLRLRETMTRTLLEELTHGRVDVVLLALPVEHPDFESLALFEDRFLLAVPAADAASWPAEIDPEEVSRQRLLLLEEGHCLRDQALTYCARATAEDGQIFGTSSLSTIVQMVANGFGVTLLPEMSIPVEIRDGRVALARFREPQPSRTIGLGWRRSSPRKRDFMELGRIIAEVQRDAAAKALS